MNTVGLKGQSAQSWLTTAEKAFFLFPTFFLVEIALMVSPCGLWQDDTVTRPRRIPDQCWGKLVQRQLHFGDGGVLGGTSFHPSAMIRLIGIKPFDHQ